MTSDIFCGKFYIRNKEYPFFLSGQVITVSQVANEYNRDFIDDYHFEYLEGITDRGKYIYLLDCDVYGGPIVSITTNLHLSCKGYILSSSPSDCFDCIEFYSAALNAFYPPRQAVSIEKDIANTHALILKFKNHEDVSQNFVCSINGESINCSLSFQSTVTLRPEDTSAVSTNTTLSMKFTSPRSIKELGKYYLYILDFLTFINFRSDIPIKKLSSTKRKIKRLSKVERQKYFNRIAVDIRLISRITLRIGIFRTEVSQPFLQLLLKGVQRVHIILFLYPATAKMQHISIVQSG